MSTELCQIKSEFDGLEFAAWKRQPWVMMQIQIHSHSCLVNLSLQTKKQRNVAWLSCRMRVEPCPLANTEEELSWDKSSTSQNDNNQGEVTVGEEKETVGDEETAGDESEEDSNLDMGSVSNSEKEANRCLRARPSSVEKDHSSTVFQTKGQKKIKADSQKLIDEFRDEHTQEMSKGNRRRHCCSTLDSLCARRA